MCATPVAYGVFHCSRTTAGAHAPPAFIGGRWAFTGERVKPSPTDVREGLGSLDPWAVEPKCGTDKSVASRRRNQVG